MGQVFFVYRIIPSYISNNMVKTTKGEIGMHLLAKRRIYITCILLTLVFGLLILRLGWVQIVQVNQTMPGFHRTVREMSVLQRERG